MQQGTHGPDGEWLDLPTCGQERCAGDSYPHWHQPEKVKNTNESAIKPLRGRGMSPEGLWQKVGLVCLEECLEDSWAGTISSPAPSLRAAALRKELKMAIFC